jgi:hypothetical protein
MRLEHEPPPGFFPPARVIRTLAISSVVLSALWMLGLFTLGMPFHDTWRVMLVLLFTIGVFFTLLIAISILRWNLHRSRTAHRRVETHYPDAFEEAARRARTPDPSELEPDGGSEPPPPRA